MSNLLSQASLVMIPSGYKEDVVYSQIPTNGSGDLSFTRASNGTRVNSAGLVEVAPWNLVQYSEDFSNGVWANYGTGTVTTNTTTAPNGTTTADKFIPNTTNTSHACEQNMGTTSGAIVMSLYAKADGYNWLCFNSYVGGFKFTWFNISTGTIGTVASGVSASIESVGNGWYRCIVSLTGGASTYFSIIPANANNVTSFAGDGTSGILIWGAQLNIGSTAKPYFPTTDRLNVPRLTYQNGGGGCPSLLLEKQSTNVFSYSQELDNGFWTPLQITITANNTTSPDGTQNADKITEDAVNGVHLFYNTSAVTGSATSTASIFYKKGTRRYFSVKLQIGSNSYTQVFDADGVTTGSNSSNGLTSVSTSIVSMGNGWVRASVTGTDPSASTACYMICSLSNSATPTFDSGNFNPSYSGSTSEYGFFWGAQLEASSYPTSYIPTTSSSATRVADACFKTGISSLIGQTEGVVFVDFVVNGRTNNANILNSEKNTTCSLFMALQTSGEFDAGLYVNGSLVGRILAGSISVGQRVKVAYAYKSGSFALYINGTQEGILSNTFTFPTTLDDIFLNDDTYFNYKEAVKYNQVALFPTRLTNAELASLTTI